MVIQCKNLISLYIIPDQRQVNLRYFDFDQNRLWGAMSLYLFSFSLHFTRSTTGGNLLVYTMKHNSSCLLVCESVCFNSSKITWRTNIKLDTIAHLSEGL